VLFDRRVWHARSVNRSNLTRKAVFFAYTYRWGPHPGQDLARSRGAVAGPAPAPRSS
jgi:ectoine hydroxylase-related dioxygenase (phytanoyl-CoA dioxygenase family)